ncbi:MAG: hypothetical protein KF872_01395 [Chitinophagales bacterium]|mgnify:CR=1 FL=1|nr:hypothetical protein [Chitinophagales bacterium]
MLRTILGIFIGLVCGVLVIVGWESFTHKLYPPPQGINFADKEAVRAMMAQMPLLAFVLILVGYVLAAFVGGAVATVIDKSKKILPALIVAGLLMLANAANLIMLPHPVWFIGASMMVYPLFAGFAAVLILRVKK